MIRLTDEEINRLTEEWLDADEDVDWATMMNKAQLRKALEYIHNKVSTTGITVKEWQTLLEEVKE